ncbi:MAG: hypothetical protein OEW48_13045 [Phycisphaerae bacterium]|nr:hypothetical protein [Phycisphaerae bacterium]
MTDKGRVTKNQLSGGVLLFTASFLLYSLASPGNLPGDTEVRWSIARQIIRGRGISLEETCQTHNYAVGIDGRRYSVYGIGQTICMLPFSGMGLALEKMVKLDPRTADLAAQFLASIILFPAIGALLVWVFYRLVLSLGYKKQTAVISCAVLAFATMNFHYSVSTQEQTHVALLLVLAILLMVTYYQQRRFIYAWLFCVALGMCLIFRLASAVMIFPVYLVASLSDVFGSGKEKLSNTIGKWLLAGILGTGGFIVACGWYNYARFGSVSESGYPQAMAISLSGRKMFESELLPTFASMLFSPGKSIFLYNPVLLLLPVCFYRFYHKHKVIAVAASVAVIANFTLYGMSTPWAGDYAWSIRYQVSVLPLLFLPVVELFGRPLKAFAKTVIISIIAVSCVIQAASVVYNFDLEFVQNPNHHLIPDDYVWDWSQSHLRKRFENIIRHTAGTRDFSSVKVTDEEPLLLKYNRSEEAVRNAYRVNFFPFKAKNRQPTEKLFYPLLSIWFVLLACFCSVVFGLFRFYIRENKKLSIDN